MAHNGVMNRDLYVYVKAAYTNLYGTPTKLNCVGVKAISSFYIHYIPLSMILSDSGQSTHLWLLATNNMHGVKFPRWHLQKQSHMCKILRLEQFRADTKI